MAQAELGDAALPSCQSSSVRDRVKFLWQHFLDDHRRRVLHVVAEVLKPFGGHSTIDHPVIGAQCYRDHANLFEANGRVWINNRIITPFNGLIRGLKD